MKIHYLYKINNLITKKYYVGMHTTSNINDGYFGSGKILQYSIKKYGIENHNKEIFMYCSSREELVSHEKSIINEELLADSLSMNIRLGGEGGGGWTSEQQKENNRRSQLKIKELSTDVDWCARRSARKTEANLRSYAAGRKITTKPHPIGEFRHSSGTKQKIGQANSNLTGERNSQFGTCWIFSDSENKAVKINKDQLDEYIQIGWRLGRK